MSAHRLSSATCSVFYKAFISKDKKKLCISVEILIAKSAMLISQKPINATSKGLNHLEMANVHQETPLLMSQKIWFLQKMKCRNQLMKI